LIKPHRDLPLENAGRDTLLRSDGRRHYLALDSLRGICACAVATAHFTSDSYVTAVPLVQHSFLFVDFFFALSGFVIAESYGVKLLHGYSVRRFMGLRLGRLWPLHAAVLFALLALQLIGTWLGKLPPTKAGHSATGFLASLFLVQVFSDGKTVEGWNSPSWSISAELWTYLLFALVARWTGRFRLPIIISLIVVMPFIIDAQTDRHLNVCYEGGLGRCIYGFFIGVLCNLSWRQFGARMSFGPLASSLLEGVAVMICGAAVWILGSGPLSYLAPPAFAFAIFLFAREAGIFSRILLTKPMLLLGAWSYSIYLLHEFIQARILNLLSIRGLRLQQIVGGETVQHMVSRTQPFPFASDALTVAMLLLTIGCAALSFRFIEVPTRRWSRKQCATKAGPIELTH
jgi:peptidoglycan/LPS O-acetylase OafA/YrhL